LDDTKQEMLMAAAQLPNVYLAVIRAIKNRPVPVHEAGEDDGGDGGEPTAE
jgi:hypothetical protein